MGLQEQVAEAIIIAFDELGGNPQDAVQQAMKHHNVEDWIAQETAIAGIAGGAEMAIPGLHTVTLPAGIAYMMHKMAYISWGIGALTGAYVIETPHYSDLRNILTIWANNSYYNAHLLDHMAIGLDAFQYALTDEGYARVKAISEDKDENNVVVKTMTILENLAYDFDGDEEAQRLVSLLTGRDDVQDLVVSASAKAPARESIFAREMERRISNRLALRLSGRISARVPARLIMGWIPVAGAIANAIFNMQSLNGFAQSALKYYDNQITRATFDD